jgi:hypothetical protein
MENSCAPAELIRLSLEIVKSKLYPISMPLFSTTPNKATRDSLLGRVFNWKTTVPYPNYQRFYKKLSPDIQLIKRILVFVIKCKKSRPFLPCIAVIIIDHPFCQIEFYTPMSG